MVRAKIDNTNQSKFILSKLSFNYDYRYFQFLSRQNVSNAFEKSIHLEAEGRENTVTIEISGLTISSFVNVILTEMQKNPLRWVVQIEKLQLPILGFNEFVSAQYKCKNPTKYEKDMKDNLERFKNLVSNTWETEKNIFPNNKIHIKSKKEKSNDGKKTQVLHHANKDYLIISCIFGVLKSICMQNVADFNDKKSSKRDSIIVQMSEKFPGKVNPVDFGMRLNAPVGVPLDMFKKYNYTRG